jgi:hypothetical protein
MSKLDFATETVTGWQGEPFSLRWRIPARPGAWAALILPGLRYTPDKPLLYYTAQALAQHNIPVAAAWVDYSRAAFQEADPQTRLQWLLADAQAALQAVRQRAGVKKVVLVGKSIGTLTIGALWGIGGLADMAASLWFTPLLAFPAVQKAARYVASPALFIASQADPSHEAAGWQAVEANPHARALLLPRGDHSLENPADLADTLTLHHQVLHAVMDFIANLPRE